MPKTTRTAPPSYCVKCRSKTATGGAVHVQSGHRHMLKGRCETCGTGKTQFVGGGFLSDLKIATPTCMTPEARQKQRQQRESLVNFMPTTDGSAAMAAVRAKLASAGRAGGSIARAGGSIARAGMGLKRAGGRVRGPRVGKGVLDEELATDLHLKR